MSAALIDLALCIRHWDWSETSQTVALFTRDHGVVRAMAKGSRRPKSPFSGGIELLTLGEIGMIRRPRSDLALLTSWDLRESYPALRSILAAHNAGMYVAEMLLQFVRDHDPHPGLFDASVRTLAAMTSETAVPEALLRFQWALLVECGFKPEIDADVATGRPLEPRPDYLFDPALGGVTSPNAEKGTPAGGWGVRAETIQLLRAVASEGGATGTALPGEAVRRANRMLASYARHILGYQTATMGVLFGDGLAR